MTKRLIDGVIFQDRQFIAMSRLAQVIYLGLQHIADDFGNARWTPQEVKGLLFARDRRATPGFLAKAMKEVEELDDIDPYEKDGWRYIHSFSMSVERAKLRYHAKSDIPSYPDTGRQTSYLASLKVSSEIPTEKVHSVGVGVVSHVGVGVDVGVVSTTPPQVTGIKFSNDLTDHDLTDFRAELAKGNITADQWLRKLCDRLELRGNKDGDTKFNFLPLVQGFTAEQIMRVISHAIEQRGGITKLLPYLTKSCQELKDKGG